MTVSIGPEALERDLAFARWASAEAGRRVLSLRATGRWEGKQLADVCDQAADGFLQGLLQGRYPEDGILSEETADSPERLERVRAWIVDPLDGTREFSEGREDWAVHVALTLNGSCALGAVALPSQGRVLWGIALPGEERAGCDGEGEVVSASRAPTGPPRVVVSRSHRPEWVDRFGEALGAASVDPWGSAGHKVGMLCTGRADVYVHKVGLKEWDTCAPETVARSLGWSVSKLRGEEHSYNRPNPKNHELVVCRPVIRDRVLAALAASGALE